MSLHTLLHRSWQRPSALTLLLLPASVIYYLVFVLNRLLYQVGIKTTWRAPMPVVVIGNLTVGGTGKTPLVIELVKQLRQAGFNPGVISRGYHSSLDSYPHLVTADSDARECGDEAVLIARRSGAPVMIGADRRASIEELMGSFPVDMVISDDGLQHHALYADVEICIHDMTQGDGNTLLLPAGPYREPMSRLRKVDLVCAHIREFVAATTPHSDVQMMLQARTPVSLADQPASAFDASRGVHAVAGIGKPGRFFDTCTALGWQVQPHSFADHHRFSADELEFADDLPVIMTEKDAVKCHGFDNPRLWYLPVDAKLQGDLGAAVVNLVNKKAGR